ncbi:hypothetical protein HBI73_155630 [Parastagonospora nodorum]|nr:hypothetical protein HBI73_155630 [Parastagonospora nodorum]
MNFRVFAQNTANHEGPALTTCAALGGTICTQLFVHDLRLPSTALLWYIETAATHSTRMHARRNVISNGNAVSLSIHSLAEDGRRCERLVQRARKSYGREQDVRHKASPLLQADSNHTLLGSTVWERVADPPPESRHCMMLQPA